jgi:hypothetical protein
MSASIPWSRNVATGPETDAGVAGVLPMAGRNAGSWDSCPGRLGSKTRKLATSVSSRSATEAKWVSDRCPAGCGKPRRGEGAVIRRGDTVEVGIEPGKG